MLPFIYEAVSKKDELMFFVNSPSKITQHFAALIFKIFRKKCKTLYYIIYSPHFQDIFRKLLKNSKIRVILVLDLRIPAIQEPIKSGYPKL